MATTTNTPNDNRIRFVLYSSLVAVSIVAVIFAIKYTTLKLRVAFADGQVRIFDGMKVLANSTTDPHKLSGQLEYVLIYYPSGSKQVTGTQLDRVVESARSNAIAEIVARLRATTGKDLGNEPDKWLKEYPPSAN
jgi:hypothetical protein